MPECPTNKSAPLRNVLLLACAGFLYSGCVSTHSEPRATRFRVMTYNIHHGEGLDGRVDLERIAEVIKRERADIVALQEVDKGVARTQRRDLSAELAALSGMSCVFSNNFNHQGGEYGNAILTRFPVLSATNLHYTMLRTNEQRGLLKVRLKVGDRELVVMNTHVDFRADDSERLLNVGQIRAAVEAHGSVPVIVCGDFNDTPGSRTHVRMKEAMDDVWEVVGQGQGLSYPAAGPTKRIDYVWISKRAPLQPVSASVMGSHASDHLPLLVELRFW
jgi:endonuclease/exonuclease/phosphatase family metal-dependent hydrolase